MLDRHVGEHANQNFAVFDHGEEALVADRTQNAKVKLQVVGKETIRQVRTGNLVGRFTTLLHGGQHLPMQPFEFTDLILCGDQGGPWAAANPSSAVRTS